LRPGKCKPTPVNKVVNMEIMRELISVFEDIEIQTKFSGDEDGEIKRQAQGFWINERMLREQYRKWKAEKGKSYIDDDWKRQSKSNILRAIKRKLGGSR
jgi:hypothetical protein